MNEMLVIVLFLIIIALCSAIAVGFHLKNTKTIEEQQEIIKKLVKSLEEEKKMVNRLKTRVVGEKPLRRKLQNG